jgi:hypothetical protein
MALIDLLKERIPNEYETEAEYLKVLNQLLDDTKNIALANLYPFEDWSQIQLPAKYDNWRLRASVERYNFLGKEGIIKYSENGLSYSFSESGLSQGLLDELISKVGTIKKRGK